MFAHCHNISGAWPKGIRIMKVRNYRPLQKSRLSGIYFRAGLVRLRLKLKIIYLSLDVNRIQPLPKHLPEIPEYKLEH